MEKDFWSAVFKLQQRLQTYQSQRTLLAKGSKKIRHQISISYLVIIFPPRYGALAT